MMQDNHLSGLFSGAELKQAFKIIAAHTKNNAPITELNPDLIEKVVDTAMPRINERTGQENDPTYMAYVLQYLYSVRGASTP